MGRVVFSPFGRQFSVLFVLVALSAMLLAGCETGSDSFSSRSQSRGSRNLAGGVSSGGSVPHFSSVAGISFMSPETVESTTPEIRAQIYDVADGCDSLSIPVQPRDFP